jgi:NhaP-type Na+/H+ or K+/H+ antiporter
LAGIRAFLLQCGIFAGIPAGILCAWLAHSMFETYGSGFLVFLYGALGGALGGVIIALLVDFIFRRLHRWAVARLALATRAGAAVRDV